MSRSQLLDVQFKGPRIIKYNIISFTYFIFLFIKTTMIAHFTAFRLSYFFLNVITINYPNIDTFIFLFKKVINFFFIVFIVDIKSNK